MLSDLAMMVSTTIAITTKKLLDIFLIEFSKDVSKYICKRTLGERCKEEHQRYRHSIIIYTTAITI